MVLRTRVSTRGQVVIPREARVSAGLRSGDELVVEVKDGSIVLRKPSRSWVEWGYGLGERVWRGVDTEACVKQERKAWERGLR
jgi:AbrB family looped-hinge helix DNA binding protein